MLCLPYLHAAQVAPPKVMAAGGSSTSVSVPRSRVAKTMAVLIDHEPLLVVTRGDQRIDMHKARSSACHFVSSSISRHHASILKTADSAQASPHGINSKHATTVPTAHGMIMSAACAAGCTGSCRLHSSSWGCCRGGCRAGLAVSASDSSSSCRLRHGCSGTTAVACSAFELAAASTAPPWPPMRLLRPLIAARRQLHQHTRCMAHYSTAGRCPKLLMLRLL